ncbi:MAG: hypothetical protein ACI8UO_002125 [Verrucomicrobiales bacterium]|jgi:hypothetical protein
MSLDLKETIGFSGNGAPTPEEQQRVREYINLKLAARGFEIVGDRRDYPFLEMGKSLLANFQERMRLLSDYLCPADQAIHNFLADYLRGVDGVFEPGAPLVPTASLIMERHGIARTLSLPAAADKFESEIVSSYRTANGVCHNPAADKRTTKGVFHITEGGLPIPADKKSVPERTFAHLLKAALSPPNALQVLPFTSQESVPAEVFVSLLLRPVVCPAVDGFIAEKTSEIRFFAPGNLVSNLDFVESIFGNAGDPFLPENDARLDVEHWSGHTGCVILAPHLVGLGKIDVGLPNVQEATERQKREGMCWESEDELYNDGGAFKITCRDKRGVMVTLIADNYFGYCKKEVKTQISYAANLFGLAEEEHAGGAIAFAGFDLGEDFQLSDYRKEVDHRFSDVVERFGEQLLVQPEGFAIDKNYPDILYLPEDVQIDLNRQRISWRRDDEDHKLQLQPDCTYVLPSGYKIEMRQPAEGQRWRLVGVNAEGTLCHKPCTVSGGGKSEISKSLSDAMETGPILMPNFADDMKQALEIVGRDFSERWENRRDPNQPGRMLLDPARSLGSAIRLLSTSPDYTQSHNDWVQSLPRSVRDLVFTIKRYWKPDWEDSWPERFHVDSINGAPGFELKYRLKKMVARYLRVGFHEDGSWRIFGLRKDFHEAAKLQREDDITASITISSEQLTGLHPLLDRPAHKFVKNCEYRLFQRPDEAIHLGYDKVTEADFSRHENFFSNYEPIDRETAQQLVDDTIRFEQFTEPMKKMIRGFLADADGPDYVISSAHPRIVEGKPTENPRYLQNRPDLAGRRAEYLAEIGSRFFRRVPYGRPAPSPVNAVLPGRRNNPADPKAGIRPLAVYSPIHYQELPELFMDFIPSLTGKSPSTTGAGSEGALTKGPFNALRPIVDLNNALVSFLLTDYPVFSSSAGSIGSKYRVDHDISLIIPEVWCRMFIPERDPKFLIERGHLERIEDFEHNGQKVLASRLGWRITESFVHTFFGRVFNEPATLFPDDMLRPERQDADEFADGVNNIVESQTRIAKLYFEDGSIEDACPPLKALLNIMASGEFEGKDLQHPEIRAMFTREQLLASDWYQDRLQAKVEVDRALLEKQARHLEEFLGKDHYAAEAKRLGIEARLAELQEQLEALRKRPKEALDRLTGTIGADPSLL